MIKLPFLIIALSMGLTACLSTGQYSKPSNLRFQEKVIVDSQEINVRRDKTLCSKDTLDKQNCPINFYIDNILAGSFYANNSANFILKSNNYNFKVKNCTEGSCQTCDVDLNTDTIENKNFTLSVDVEGKPFILNNDKPLECSNKKQVAPILPVESTIKVNLAADTLFKFNGSSLNDLLPKGRQEILNVASQISNNFISIREIKLIGHTDRLGSDTYNQQLGLNRANTVRSLLIKNGVAENIISTSSLGKKDSVTKGCFDIREGDALKVCLQPDRRVSVEITGISK